MTVSESCYGQALRALNRKRLVVLIPGQLDNEPCVTVCSYHQPKARTPDRGFLYHHDPGMRVAYLLGVALEAREDARARGVTAAD